MRSLLVSLVAGWAVLRWCSPTLRWPIRMADLELVRATPTRPSAPRRPVARVRPGPPAAAVSRRPRRRSGSTARAVQTDLIMVLDLLRLALSAGHTLHTALGAVTTAMPGAGPVSEAVAAAARSIDAGSTLIEAIDEMHATLGERVGPLATTLTMSLGSGSQLGPALGRLAEQERRRARRGAEQRVRRLPVLMLGPLVGLILPAFVLLTIVPVASSTAARTALLAG